jgi:hypothetical protein
VACMCVHVPHATTAVPLALAPRPVQPLVCLSICRDLRITRLLHVSPPVPPIRLRPLPANAHYPSPPHRSHEQSLDPTSHPSAPPARSSNARCGSLLRQHPGSAYLAYRPHHDGVHHEVEPTQRLIECSRFASAEDNRVFTMQRQVVNRIATCTCNRVCRPTIVSASRHVHPYSVVSYVKLWWMWACTRSAGNARC